MFIHRPVYSPQYNIASHRVDTVTVCIGCTTYRDRRTQHRVFWVGYDGMF